MAVAWILQWTILLSSYNYNLKYRFGKENSKADFWSRFPSPESKENFEMRNEAFKSEMNHSAINLLTLHIPFLQAFSIIFWMDGLKN